MTTGQIAKKHGVNVMTINNWARKAGLPSRSRGRRKRVRPTPRQKQIVELARISTYETVGRKFGMSRQAVFQIVERWGMLKTRIHEHLTQLPERATTTGR